MIRNIYILLLLSLSYAVGYSQGFIVCWGWDDYGQVYDTPDGTFTDVFVGGGHTCVLDESGSIECWGRDNHGQVYDTPDGTFTDGAAGFAHTCVLDESGSIECWGWDSHGQVYDTPDGTFIDVAAGSYHTCALDESGSIECWGDNSWGLGYPPEGTFTEIAAGTNHTCALDESGSIVCWGYDAYGQSSLPEGTFTDVATGGFHTCALDESGSIECWGWDEYGQSSLPEGTFTDVGVGSFHTCALDESGSIECWGRNNYGQLSPPEGTFIDVAAGYYHNCALTMSAGCTDPEACNYDADATVDDGSCLINDCAGDCGGDALVDDCGDCSDPSVFNSGQDDCGVCYGGNADQDCNGVCFGENQFDQLGECCVIEDLDICLQCYGNNYDQCDGDSDGIPNIEDWGYGAHSIVVQDVPEDQGGRVYLSFHKSFYDTDDLRSEAYTIQRLDGEEWVIVQSFGAFGEDDYTVETTTLYNNVITEFKVIANMDEGNFQCYENGFGESIDNIYPIVPTGLMASLEDESVVLNWDQPVDSDFQYFTIYRDDELIEYSTESTYTENVYGEFEYYITATDANGNESGQSESVMIEIEPLTGDVNDDYEVNIQDILVMINMILPDGIEPTDAADLNQDGIVNILDILILINIILNP